eukprot:TRINITY_DN23301_c0_g1_i1.p1 TRINITY_DN23301_c0_g1~~TRINITY_DN23301_c0_g1_i1.p1  ORF type:complete len:289 (-),score=53.95 TRINITY_DN23301_c0_g1_i1:37-903(-)
MYNCFLKDVRLESHRNQLIPAPQALRFSSFNVRFFRSGYGALKLADTTSEILRIIKTINADIYAFQEVPESTVDDFQKQLSGVGYHHTVVAAAPAVHQLTAGLSFGEGEQLMVILASRRKFAMTGQASLGDGSAAFGAVDLGNNRLVFAYSVHLSVRCPPEARKEQIWQLLKHESPGAALVLIGGDMQQPEQSDYPSEEWAAIARDLTAAKLPLSDGVLGLFLDSGFSQARLSVGVRMTAWNGVVVDKMFFKFKHPNLLKYEAGYTYFTNVSDHLPIISDFAFAAQVT